MTATHCLNVAIPKALKKRMDLVKAHTGETLAAQVARALDKQTQRDLERIDRRAAKA